MFYYFREKKRSCLPVLDEPVVFSVLCAVADDQDPVVKLTAAAAWLAVHPTVVHLEAGVAGVNGNRDGTHGCGSLLQSILITGSNVCVARIGGTNISAAETAGTVLRKTKQYTGSKYI